MTRAQLTTELIYPTTSPVQQLNGFVWTPYARPCVVCNWLTCWVDLAFECPIHPGRCSEKLQDEYNWAQCLASIRAWRRGEKPGTS